MANPGHDPAVICDALFEELAAAPRTAYEIQVMLHKAGLVMRPTEVSRMLHLLQAKDLVALLPDPENESNLWYLTAKGRLARNGGN